MAERISIAAIQRLVAAHYCADVAEMRSDRRGREAARPRQAAMYLAWRLTPHSLNVIGRAFGGREHSTVLYAVRAVEKRMAEDPAELAAIRGLISRANVSGESDGDTLRGVCRALRAEVRAEAARVDGLLARTKALENAVAEMAP